MTLERGSKCQSVFIKRLLDFHYTVVIHITYHNSTELTID